MIIETKGPPRGLMAPLSDQPLLARDLKGIPVNPAQAYVFRLDLDQLVEQVLKVADQVDPMPREQFEFHFEPD